MRISIVLATHNGAEFIAEQVRSLATQSLLPFELVVVDDHSSDNTLELVLSLAAECPFPLRIFSNDTTVGFSDNFMGGCAHASGDIIAFCDQDDVWLPDKLKTVDKIFGSSPNVNLVVHACSVVDASLNPLGASWPVIPDAVLKGPLESPLIPNLPGFAMSFRRSLYDDYPWQSRPVDFDFAPRRLNHDAWIAILANVEGGIYLEPEKLVLYRRHGNKATAFRAGNNRKRRLGQWRDALLAPPRIAFLTKIEVALNASKEYFDAASEDEGRPVVQRNKLRTAARRYGLLAELARWRLAFYQQPRMIRPQTLLHALTSGQYSSAGHFHRRFFFEDLAGIFKSSP